MSHVFALLVLRFDDCIWSPLHEPIQFSSLLEVTVALEGALVTFGDNYYFLCFR